MWYKFLKDQPIGQLRVERAHLAWYDMERGGDCFDENFIFHQGNNVETLKSIGMWLPYVEMDINADKRDKSRVFICMDDGEVYELLLKKLTKEEFEKCNNFYGGRDER
jgi:hypothetical protein